VQVHATWAIVEASRPSFLAVPPSESVYCSFDAREHQEGHLDLIILYANPYMPTGARTVCDTKAPGVTVDTVSPCASIPAFCAASAFKIFANDKNAIVKVHMDGHELTVTPRNGNAIARIGLVQRLKGLRFGGNMLDMETNSALVKNIFSVSC